jgi:ABC-type Co2+ transport system permease subunit
LKELLLLAGIYTLINPSLHFILWHLMQVYSETSVQDFVAMAVGDLAGAVLGSVLFVWVVRHTGLAQWVAGRVHLKTDR